MSSLFFRTMLQQAQQLPRYCKTFKLGQVQSCTTTRCFSSTRTRCNSDLSQPQTFSTHHPPRLHDRVAIVTGSSSGLGRAIALQYASHGTKLVVCADLQSEPRHEGVEQDSVPTHEVINRMYGKAKAVFVKANVNNTQEVKEMVEAAVRHGGRLDV